MAYAADPIEPDVDLTRVGTANTDVLLAEDGEALNAGHRLLTTATGGIEWPDGRCTHDGALRTVARLRLPATSDAHTAVAVFYDASVAAGGGGTVTFATTADSISIAVGGDVSGETSVDAPAGVDTFVLDIKLSAASGSAVQLDRMSCFIGSLTTVEAGRVDSVGTGEAFTPGRIATDGTAYASWQAREVCETGRTLDARVRLIAVHSELDLAGGATVPAVVASVDFDIPPAAARSGRRLVVWVYATGGDADDVHRFVVTAAGFFRTGVVEVEAEAAAAWYSTEVDLPVDLDAATFTPELGAEREAIAWSAWLV